MHEYKYAVNCIGFPQRLVHKEGGLNDMIGRARPISRKTFVQTTDRKSRMEVEKNLGYAIGNNNERTMASDWHVRYYSSKLFGERVYFFTWSSIEYIFTETGRLPK